MLHIQTKKIKLFYPCLNSIWGYSIMI